MPLSNIPIINISGAIRPFSQFLTLDGDGLTRSMIVDGSVTNQVFSIPANANYDLYIKTISIVISAANADLGDFGSGSALTNGIEVSTKLTSQDIILEERLQSNFDFIQWALGEPAYGDAIGAFRALNVVGTSDAYLPSIDFEKVYGLPYGIKLNKDTDDIFSFIIKDNLTALGLNRFDAVITGIRI